MLRDAVGYTCEVKTAQETAKESVGIIGKSEEIRGKLVNFGGIWGKLGENSVEIGGNEGKLVNCVSPMVKQNSQTVKSISPTSGKKGENETGGGNEREMKGNFVFTTSFNCTVLYQGEVLSLIRCA